MAYFRIGCKGSGGTAQSTYRFNAFCSNGTSNHSIYLTKDMVKGFTKFKITTEMII